MASKRHNKTIGKVIYSYSTDDEEVAKAFKSISTTKEMEAFYRKHKQSHRDKIGSAKCANEYKTIEPCIRTSSWGKFCVRVGARGKRYEKSFDTLEEARAFRDEVKSTGTSNDGRVFHEGNCAVPKEVVVSSNLKFDYDEKLNRMVVKVWSNKRWKVVPLSPEKTKELRNSLNGTLRRVKRERKAINPKNKRDVNTKPRRNSGGTSGEQQSLIH